MAGLAPTLALQSPPGADNPLCASLLVCRAWLRHGGPGRSRALGVRRARSTRSPPRRPTEPTRLLGRPRSRGPTVGLGCTASPIPACSSSSLPPSARRGCRRSCRRWPRRRCARAGCTMVAPSRSPWRLAGRLSLGATWLADSVRSWRPSSRPRWLRRPRTTPFGRCASSRYSVPPGSRRFTSNGWPMRPRMSIGRRGRSRRATPTSTSRRCTWAAGTTASPTARCAISRACGRRR